MVKIKEYKIQKHGARGISITLPKVWIEDNNLAFGDTIEVYRDIEDRIILSPKRSTKRNDQAIGLRTLMDDRK